MSGLSQLKPIQTEEVLAASDTEAEKPKNPESTVVIWPKSERTFPAFQYCYLEREALSNGKLPHEKTRNFLVITESLCPKRRDLVATWIQEMVRGKCNINRAIHIGQALTWIDQNKLKNILFVEEDAKRLYRQYTSHLIQLVKEKEGDLNSVDGINLIHAGNLQRGMQSIIEYSIGISRRETRKWATILSRSNFDPWYAQFDTVEPIELSVDYGIPQDSEITPENTRVAFKPTYSGSINAFKFCYLDRASLTSVGRGRSNQAQVRVRLSSISKQRCRLVLRWVKDMLTSSKSLDKSNTVCVLFDWIDRAKRDSDLYEKSRSQPLYQDFTAHLKDAISDNALSLGQAVKWQAEMRYILSLSNDIPASEIEEWAPKITLQIEYSNLDNAYVEVETYELIGDSEDKAPNDVVPEQAVVNYPLQPSYKIHAYKFCYLDRASLIPDVSPSSAFARRVNPASLCPKRCKLMARLIRLAINGALVPYRAYRIVSIMDWIDAKGRGEDLHSVDDAKRLYADFTQYLLHMARLSQVGDKKGFGLGTACHKQEAMADLIKLSTNVPLYTVRTWATQLTRNAQDLPQPRLTENDAKTAYHLHSRFFWGYSQLVLSDHAAAAPLKIQLSDLGYEDFVAFNHNVTSYTKYGARGAKKNWRNVAFSEAGFDDDIQSVARKTKAQGICFDANQRENYRASQRVLVVDNFQLSEGTIRHFANRAIKHFGYMLMFASGCNADHLSGIDCQKSLLPKEDGANRMIAFKGRAKNELQKVTVPSAFQKDWRQMIRLREWMSSYCDQDAPKFGLCYVPLRGNNKNKLVKLDDRTLKDSLAWPENGPSLVSRTARKSKIQRVLEISGGDVGLVAEMVSNKPNTIQKHYGFKTFEDSAKQLSQFFTALKTSANLRVSGKVKPPIVSSGEKILTGKCVAKTEDDRRYIDGIDEVRAPELTCGAPLACFFCKSFGIFNNYEDIHRILSVAAYIKFQSIQRSQALEIHGEKFLPIVARIEEIVEAFKKRSKAAKDIVQRSSRSIEKGDLDPFWLAQVNSLLDAIEVS
ncbi:hypothetical protein [Marinobacter sp. OP 3.4]|uniref:hypothetical protein n=1 Tax=Marinobacter sp. OP 3.4 TaxID=3076501 RepID=UPI002E1BCBE4